MAQSENLYDAGLECNDVYFLDLEIEFHLYILKDQHCIVSIINICKEQN